MPVRRAPELLLDQRPLHPRPALAAVLGGVQAAVQPRGDPLALDHARSSPAAGVREGARPPARAGSGSRRRTVAARSRSSASSRGELERQAVGVRHGRGLGRGHRHLGSSSPPAGLESERESVVVVDHVEGQPGGLPDPWVGGLRRRVAARRRASASQRRYARRRAREIRLSNRSRSRATAAGVGSSPCRSAAIASGSSDSGSGVIESHVLCVRLTRALQISVQLTTKSAQAEELGSRPGRARA